MTTVTPGVYFQATSPPAAVPAQTGVPAFLGFASGGPWTATALSPADDVSAAFPATGFLDAAVQGFFANGGRRCHVVRLRADQPAATALAAGLAALEDADADLICLPDLVNVPTWADASDLGPVTSAQRLALDHCADRGDRFAVLDAVPSSSATVVAAQRQALGGPSASFGALYAPWVLADSKAVVPPCGHVSGIYAAMDAAAGTQRAPAGVELAALLDVQVAWGDADLASLTSSGVNVVRALRGRGLRPWGARTVSDDPQWRDITARRVVTELVRWLETFMTGLVDEPNDVRLWVTIMREVTAYLDGLYQRGALRGATADAAFYVKCDSETNPPAQRAGGQVVTQVGVALAAQAEVLVLNVVRTPDAAVAQVT
ncbi:MAG TPA: phage tail sheath subtilisin-like domain-containing protein [Trebonia sp.]|jgi:hypothetical protein|nr:phage tail sheath subtilisin-like domain-containing protein [Trebonia sp.]